MKLQGDKVVYNILVIGANGGIGRQCVQMALSAGHRVTAVLRTPSKLTLTHPNLEIVQGDIMNSASIMPCFKDKHVVISTLGVSGGLGSDKPTKLYSQGAKVIEEAAKNTGPTRAFFISASAIEVSPVLPFFIRLIIKYILQKILKHMYADLRKMEQIVKDSDMNWTIIRPPKLTDQPETGNYRVAINKFLKNCLKISRADVAHFIIHNIANEAIYQSAIEISY